MRWPAPPLLSPEARRIIYTIAIESLNNTARTAVRI
jgi:hypothetical protein